MKAILKFLGRNVQAFFLVFFVYSLIILVPISKALWDYEYQQEVELKVYQAQAVNPLIERLLKAGNYGKDLRQIVESFRGLSVLIAKKGRAIYLSKEKLPRGKMVVIYSRRSSTGYLIQYLVKPKDNILRVLSDYLQKILSLSFWEVPFYREIFGYHLAAFFFIVSVMLMDKYKEFFQEENEFE